MDRLSTSQRSALMRQIRGKDTRPELRVRRLVHRLGYRYRLHKADLPGSPDLVLASRRKAIFVHGCFWHRHDCPLGRKWPTTRQEYWIPKLKRNQRRDHASERGLQKLGFDVLVIWECETRDQATLAARLAAFLGE